MPVTRSLALAIIQIVAKDAECQRRITSGFSIFGKHSGSFRNAEFCIANLASLNKCAPDTEQQKKVCYGVVDATVEAINKVVVQKNRPGTLSAVRFASEIGRNVEEAFEHYGTKLVLSSPLDNCVFDWWSTLTIDNPLIYQSSADFVSDGKAVLFSQLVDG